MKKHGTDKILFGTDSPWENQQDYVKRISHMDFTKEQWYEVIEKTVPPKTIEINKKAFDVGYYL